MELTTPCSDPRHDKNNGNRWHRWEDEQGHRWAAECPDWLRRREADARRKRVPEPEREERERYP